MDGSRVLLLESCDTEIQKSITTHAMRVTSLFDVCAHQRHNTPPSSNAASNTPSFSAYHDIAVVAMLFV
jgi:hypothetical protein